MPSASYNANDVLSKLLTVDGAGTGLDADLLDGLNSSSTLPVVTNKSSVVTRDSTGNFSANLITATVTNSNALNGVVSNGFISRISAGNHLARIITGTDADIVVANGDGVSGNPTISAGTNLARRDSTNTYTLPQSFALITANALSNDGNNNLFTGLDNLSPTSTNGFIYVPMIAGTPSGTPTTNTGRSPVVWDSTNNKLWIYSAGVWNSVSGGIPDGSITPTKLSTGAPSWDVNGNVSIAGNTTLGNANTDVTTVSGAVSLNGSVGVIGQVATSQGVNQPLIWANPASGFSNMQVFNASGTFTVPLGITKVKVTVVGGGGNGGNGTFGSAGYGGGGGGSSIGIYNVTSGSGFAVTVGGASGTSSFGGLISASGGAAGSNSISGSGGVGSGGQINIRGDFGFIPNVRGGTGGSSILSGAGFGAIFFSAGGSAFANSGGGGGGGGSGLILASGGAGGSGVVIVEF